MSADTSTQLEVQGTQPDNFTMLPNMAIIDLSANAYKLLAIYLDTAKTNQVYAKNSTLSKKLGVTVNTMKKARKELADKGYIIFATGKDGADTTTARVVIQINWMWSENHKRMSNSDNRVSNSDTPLSNIDTLLSNSDTNNQYLKNKDLKEIPHISPDQDMNLTADKNELVTEMQALVKSELKQYDAKRSRKIACGLLGYLIGDNAQYNLDTPITPEQFKQFVTWWDRCKVKADGEILTRPKNLGSVKSNVMEWQDAIANQQPKQQVKFVLTEPLKYPSLTGNYMPPKKKEGA